MVNRLTCLSMKPLSARFGYRPIRSSGLSVSGRKMAPLVCHRWQKCADSLTAEAGWARRGHSKTMPEELPVWLVARVTPCAKAGGCLSVYSLTPRGRSHFPRDWTASNPLPWVSTTLRREPQRNTASKPIRGSSCVRNKYTR